MRIFAAALAGALALLCAWALLSCSETPGDYPSFIETETGAELWIPQPLAVEAVDPEIAAALEEAAEFWPCVEVGPGRGTALFGYVPSPNWPEEDRWGMAAIRADTETGEIWQCSIIVASEIQYSYDTVVDVLIHEIGHCLGLADDPGVESIMASPPGWILRSEDQGACR